MENLDGIRKRIRRLRQAVSVSARSDWSRQACSRIVRLSAFTEAKKIAGFLAFDGEADPLELLVMAVNLGKQVYVPIIVGKNKPLKFSPWTMTTKMKRNRFGIYEPDLPESEWIDATDLDFVITPLVAFDESCHRIGVGGGYYDRSFAFLKDGDPSGKPSLTRIGFAFELQKLDKIKPKPWDMSIDGVATESGYYQRT